MTTELMKTLELHYSMIQFLIIGNRTADIDESIQNYFDMTTG